MTRRNLKNKKELKCENRRKLWGYYGKKNF